MRRLTRSRSRSQAWEGLCQVDVARRGLDNMAIDQAMLEQTAVDSLARLRIYRWSEPTVSLGYFQKFSDFEGFETTRGLPVVRRATGGGAIVHHYDWTYSIAMPSAELGSQTQGASTRLYDCVHGAVVSWLAQRGITAQLWSPQLLPELNCPTSGCSFLCFERRHAGDVVCGSSKILGSAQRRLGGALLQHGSFLLQKSPYAPSLAGLVELAEDNQPDLELSLPDFFLQLVNELSAEFALPFRSTDWVTDVLPKTDSIKSKLDSSQWTARI